MLPQVTTAETRIVAPMPRKGSGFASPVTDRSARNGTIRTFGNEDLKAYRASWMGLAVHRMVRLTVASEHADVKRPLGSTVEP